MDPIKVDERLYNPEVREYVEGRINNWLDDLSRRGITLLEQLMLDEGFGFCYNAPIYDPGVPIGDTLDKLCGEYGAIIGSNKKSFGITYAKKKVPTGNPNFRLHTPGLRPATGEELHESMAVYVRFRLPE